MDLKNQPLNEWLQKAPASCYPHKKKVDHYTQYKKLKDYLFDNVHKDVTIGANLKDPGILLNDHGPEHIETVIRRASDLIHNSKCSLTPYESYILLCCIEVHDVGNILGRMDHEKNSKEIILNAPGVCGRDSIEAKTITRIAETHGGKLSNGSQGKINTLEVEESLTYGKIRSRLIASILRFADELADDKTRANTSLLLSGKIPKKSEVFHAYAHCLQSVNINHSEQQIELKFMIHKNFLKKSYGKMNKNVMLINEIYDRLYKMHLERMYCMSHSRGLIDLEKIRVDIEFYDDRLSNPFPRMVFDLEENGYPDTKRDIYKICPYLMSDGTKKDGVYYKKLANEKPL